MASNIRATPAAQSAAATASAAPTAASAATAFASGKLLLLRINDNSNKFLLKQGTFAHNLSFSIYTQPVDSYIWKRARQKE